MGRKQTGTERGSPELSGRESDITRQQITKMRSNSMKHHDESNQGQYGGGGRCSFSRTSRGGHAAELALNWDWEIGKDQTCRGLGS